MTHQLSKTPILICSASLAALLVATGCGDDETSTTTTATTTTSNTTSSTGGSGGGGMGAGGIGGAGGDGGAGGANPCLDPSEHASHFAIDEPGLCLVAQYTAPFVMGYSIIPSWGRHNGPLTMTQSTSPLDEVTLTRWTAPSSSTGLLTASETIGPIDLDINQPTLFMNGSAVDLPSHNWTFVGWGAYGSTDGEAIMLSEATVAARWNAASLYAGVGVDDGAGTSRLLHSASTPLDAPTATDGPGLYAADICAGPTLCGEHSMALGGYATGPVVLDGDGNLFTTFPDLANGNQTLRGFSATEIAPTSTATAGTEIFTTNGSGTALAATAPAGDASGTVFLQVFNGQTFMAENVMAHDYDVTGGTVTPTGSLGTALTMVTAGTTVNLMTDGDGRLWVAVDTESDEITFFVLARLD